MGWGRSHLEAATFPAWRNRRSPSSGSTTRPSCSNRTACSCGTKGSRSRPPRTPTTPSRCSGAGRSTSFSSTSRCRGSAASTRYREVRELAPNLPVVMVTKSEDDATLREALGADVGDYLVKPVNPRQVCGRDPDARRAARSGSRRSRARSSSGSARSRSSATRDLDWRGWIDRYDELMHWDLDLVAASETGLYESLRGLYPDMHREFAPFMQTAYPAWLRDLEGDRPPLSIDIVGEFLLPVLKRDKRGGVRRRRLPAARSVARARAAARAALRRRDDALLRACCRRRRRTRATRCSAACFPARSRRASPTGGASARTKRSTRTSASCSRRSCAELKRQGAGALREDLDRRRRATSSSADSRSAIAPEGITRSCSTSSTC